MAVTGNLKDITTGNVTTNVQVDFELQNFGSQIPHIVNTTTIVQIKKSFRPDVSGNISGSIYPNSVITPGGTFYRVCILIQGTILRCNNYLINGPFDLNSAIPLNITPIVGPSQLITQIYPCLKITPATTWVCVHNFGDFNIDVALWDASGNKIGGADNIQKTDANTVTITWVVPQDGLAVIMHAGSISIATNQPNAVLQNPPGAQTVSQAISFLGPVTMASGGSLSGTFSGNHTLSGNVTITGVLTLTNPWTSSVTTGTAPFSVASATVIPNLNASLLGGATFAAPGPIGGTTPAAGTFTTLTANTSLSIAGGTALTTTNRTGTGNLVLATSPTLGTPTLTTPVLNGMPTGTGLQGTEALLLTAGTVSGTGSPLCLSANGGATTSGCPAVPPIVKTGSNSSVCSTGSGAGSSCTTTVTWSGGAFADSSYFAFCSGVGPVQFPFYTGITTQSASTVTVQITNGTASEAQISTFASIGCVGVHP